MAISPFYQNVSIAQNQSSALYNLTLSNTGSVAQTFKLTTQDFGSLNQSAGVAFLNSSSSYAKQYGLAAWMQLDQNVVTIPGGSSVQVTVKINNSSSLTPGGHYGAVLATAQSAPVDKPTQPRVGVLAVLSSLILLVKGGGPPPNLDLKSQTVYGRGLGLPSQVDQQFLNLGDVHVVPRGVVQVLDPAGHLVERGALNVNSGIILPSTYRDYSTPLVKLASAWLPGNYTVVTKYRYDGTTATKTFSSQFWYFSAFQLWALLTILMTAVAAMILWWRKRARR
jgi:hypothetical protein